MNIGFNTEGHFWTMKCPKGTQLNCGYKNCRKDIDMNSVFYYCKQGEKAICESCMFSTEKGKAGFCAWNFPIDHNHGDYCIKQVEYES